MHFKIDAVKTWIRKALTTERLQEAQIKSLMQAQMLNNYIMSLIQQSTGFSLPMIIKSSGYSIELDDKLKSWHKVS